MDNCTRENKNKYMLGYLEILVAWGVFTEVHASFLPLGHTHTDIDQLFSRTATRLHTHSAVTLKDLQEELKLAYTPTPSVESLDNVINFSGLCDQEQLSWDSRGRPFSQFRYFKFSRTERQSEDDEVIAYYGTTCSVKINSMDDWQALRMDGLHNGFGGFIKRTPDLCKTPPLKLKSPVNKSDVLKRLQSEETRIGST